MLPLFHVAPLAGEATEKTGAIDGVAGAGVEVTTGAGVTTGVVVVENGDVELVTGKGKGSATTGSVVVVFGEVELTIKIVVVASFA